MDESTSDIADSALDTVERETPRPDPFTMAAGSTVFERLASPTSAHLSGPPIDTPVEPPMTPTASTEHSAQLRIGDLEAQLDFMRAQVEELRQKLETERIDHAERLLAYQEAAHRSLDGARGDFAQELQRHNALRTELLADAQERFENELAAQSQRHETAIERERTAAERKIADRRRRADKRIEIAQRRFADERSELEARLNELSERDPTADHQALIAGLRRQLDATRSEAAEREADTQRKESDYHELERRIDQINEDHERQVGELTAEIGRARSATEAERGRTAAVREELLTKSASLARLAEDDVRKHDEALRIERIKLQEHLAEATQRYRLAIEQAENRLRIASARETDLEATVLNLRADVARSRERPRH